MTEDIPLITHCPVAPLKPFAPCDPGELEPLLSQLSTTVPATEPRAFPRGTLLPDGRLDLCKQQIGPTGAASIAKALASHPHVRAVLMGADGIGDAGARSVANLVASNSAIQTTYLGCNGIGPAGVHALCDAIDSGAALTGLWLKRNPIGDDGLLRIAKTLEQNKTIRTLDLVNTQIGSDGLKALADVLRQSNRTVRRVYLGGNGIGPPGAELFADVLRENPSLVALLLNASRVGDLGAAAIAEALRVNRSLEVLGLAANELSAGGASQLFQAIATHPSLRKIDLGYCASARAVGAEKNQIGDEGACAAARMLRENTTLVELDISHNGVGVAGVSDLVNAIEESNFVLRRLNIAVSMPDELKVRLRRVITRNRDGSADWVAADADVLAIRSVYRS